MVGTLKSEQFDDIYFSLEDGLAETKHVFLDGNDLSRRFMGQSDFCIAETGFGTGLNFLSAWTLFDQVRKDQDASHLTYIAFEKYPLSAEVLQQALMQWAHVFEGRLTSLVEQYPLRVTGFHTLYLADNVTLLLVFDDVNRALPELNARVDAWFLDGFAPSKNPDMWSETVFSSIAACSKKGASLASFTAAGFVRRGLEQVGFAVERVKGFGRKRHMIRAQYVLDAEPVQTAALNNASRRVAVIGGGIAGASMVRSLRARHMHVTLYEQADSLAAWASGNRRGLFNPRFTQQRGFDSDFYGSAFALGHRVFQRLGDAVGYVSGGSVHLATDADKKKRFLSLLNTWGWHENHARAISSQDVSDIVGAAVSFDGLYLPDAGSVDPYKTCHVLSHGAEIYLNNDVPEIIADGDGWRVHGQYYDAVVLCCAYAVRQFEQTQFLSVDTVRGQILYAAETAQTSRLKSNLCYGGYCSPSINGQHVVGSSFQPWLKDIALREEDNNEIIHKLESVVPTWAGDLKPVAARAALRTASKDRVPVGGKIQGCNNLYASVAHGSHGLISALAVADLIGAMIAQKPLSLPRSVIARLDPMRFHGNGSGKIGGCVKNTLFQS